MHTLDRFAGLSSPRDIRLIGHYDEKQSELFQCV